MAKATFRIWRGDNNGGSFQDLDGHHWQVIWMDPKAVA